jgi:hypothetical protein
VAKNRPTTIRINDLREVTRKAPEIIGDIAPVRQKLLLGSG